MYPTHNIAYVVSHDYSVYKKCLKPEEDIRVKVHSYMLLGMTHLQNNVNMHQSTPFMTGWCNVSYVKHRERRTKQQFYIRNNNK